MSSDSVIHSVIHLGGGKEFFKALNAEIARMRKITHYQSVSLNSILNEKRAA